MTVATRPEDVAEYWPSVLWVSEFVAAVVIADARAVAALVPVSVAPAIWTLTWVASTTPVAAVLWKVKVTPLSVTVEPEVTAAPKVAVETAPVGAWPVSAVKPVAFSTLVAVLVEAEEMAMSRPSEAVKVSLPVLASAVAVTPVALVWRLMAAAALAP
ncbi:hypothetical protein GALL_475000 [mine drainage metagenome]|uniref:Uncharacterized protein n=1 Tax=mine drainage metagenome TaxID=410659 RepID=A0A1J5PTG2_9ZZZZ